MKKGWDTKQLSEVCDFGNGLWKGKKPPFIEVGVIRNTNFTKDCHLDCSDIAFLNVEQSQFAKRKLKYGDIILEKSGGGPKQAVGRVVIFDKHDGDFSFSNFTSLMRVKHSEELDFNYLHKYLFFSYLSGVTEKMQSHSTGIRNLKFGEYKQMLVPLPPLPEQKRIVGILDKAIAAISTAKANAEKNLANARELFESYLQDIFANPGDGWEEKSLEEIGKITSSKRIYKREYVKEGIPFYRIKEIKELANGKNITIDLYISKSRYAEIKEAFGVPVEEDILMTAVGTIGEIYVVKKDEKFYFKDGNVLWFKDFNSIDSYFLKFALMVFVEKIKRLSIGSAYNALTIEKIEKHKIYVPPLPEQKSIVAKLDELSAETKKLETICRQKLADLEELKKSVLQKAFNGELTKDKRQ